MGDWTFQKNDSTSTQAVEQVPGAFRRVLADSDRMMVIEWKMNAGVVIPTHNHPHEQSGYLISGEMLFNTGGVEHSITPGTGYAVAPGVPHGARFPVETVLVDIFSPPREDYRGSEASTYSLSAVKPERTARARRTARRSTAKRSTRKPTPKGRAAKTKKRR